MLVAPSVARLVDSAVSAASRVSIAASALAEPLPAMLVPTPTVSTAVPVPTTFSVWAAWPEKVMLAPSAILLMSYVPDALLSRVTEAPPLMSVMV